MSLIKSREIAAKRVAHDDSELWRIAAQLGLKAKALNDTIGHIQDIQSQYRKGGDEKMFNACAKMVNDCRVAADALRKYW